ncbi:MAG TPA: S8 family serine peptidase [Pirellulaceae bacterium]|nr:S8 family serine peptidase [Pirellulaceae bacterium]
MSLVRSFGRSGGRQRHFSARRLFLEQLEDRALLHAAAGTDAADAGAIGHINWHGQSAHVVKGEWIARFDGVSGTPTAQVATLNRQLAGSSIHIQASRHLGLDGMVLIKAPSALSYHDLAGVLDDVPGFRYVQPNFAEAQLTSAPEDPLFGELYGLHNTGQDILGVPGINDADIDAPEAWDITTGSNDVIVGVIDTGVDYNHPDLAANIWTNALEAAGAAGVDDDGNGFTDDIHGYDFINGDGDPMDGHSHGTHVSGTIGAVGDNDVGVAGVNWKVKIMALKIFDDGGFTTDDAIVSAINYAAMMRNRGFNLKLTSNSWGGGPPTDAIRDAIQANRDAGLLFIAAAGNYSQDNDFSPFYPASYDTAGDGTPLDNVISVAATDNQDNLAWFSSYGHSSVDLGAPGVSTLSTVPGGGYDYFDGTSMATPHVSGVAALAYSIAGTASYSQIRDCLFNGTDPIPSLDGITVTGGRLNALGTLTCVGMAVSGSSPAAGEIVSSPPTVFTIDFSHPYDTSTDDPGDLTVNGLAANSVTEIGSNTLQFTFTTSPVTTQGIQTMHMDGGAVSASPGSGLLDPLLKPWTATFSYDALPMEVVATDPADGSPVQLSMNSLAVLLNEAVGAGSVQASDLQLSQGSATDVSISGDGKTLTFTLNGITQEGTLSASIAAGALTDAFGNPNLAYSSSYILDIGTLEYPTPLFPIAPKGSLIYDPAASAFINPADDADSFTINVDAGQTITVLVTPDSGLRPQVTLKKSGVPDVVALAPAAGQEAVLQTAGPTTAGTYTIVVESVADATTGHFTVQVFLNSALELESHGGPSNSSRATAENIDSSFVPLLKTATRGAVLGQTDATTSEVWYSQNFEGSSHGFTVDNSLSGLWHVTTARGTDGGHSATHSFYYGKEATGGKGKPSAANYIVKSKGKAGGSIRNAGSLISPSLTLPTDGALTLDFNYWLKTQGSATLDMARLQVRPSGSSSWATLATYNSVAEHSFWAPSAPVDVSAFAGQTVQFRWFFDTINGDANNFEGWLVDDVRIVKSAPHDMYSFTATVGQRVTVALQALGGGSINVQLLSPAGATLASGQTGQTNVDRMIYDFGPLAEGTHYLAITGDTNTPYSLLVTKNAVFDRESNDTLATAQPFGSNQVALGYISPSVGDILWVGPHSLGWNDGSFDITQITVDQFATQSLSGYDILYVDASAEGLSILHSRAADVAAFVNAGGGLITDDGGSFNTPDFGWTPHGASLAWVAEHQEVILLTAAGMVHPVTAGLTNDGLSFWGNSQHSFFTATAGLAELATNPTGDPNILAGSFGAGRVVYFGLDPSFHQPVGETVQLLRQAAAWVGDPAPEADVYSFTSLGGLIHLFTSTPGDGGGQFVNTLNPSLRLYNSAGVEVGEVTPLGDGRNEEVNYPGAPAGTYYVRVSAESGIGEYILDPVTSVAPAPSSASLALLANAPAGKAGSSSLTLSGNRKTVATSRSAAARLSLTSAGRRGIEASDPSGELSAAVRSAALDVTLTDAVFAEGSWLSRSGRRRR